MHFQIDYPESKQLLKRSFSRSSHWRDSDSLQPSKRHQQLPPTLQTPRHSLDKSPPPSCPEDAPLTLPESSRSLRKRKSESDHSTPNTPTKRRIEDWLRNTRPRRRSYPPKVKFSDPDTDTGKGLYASIRRKSYNPQPEISDPEAQRPLLDVLQEMSQGARAGSSTSSRNARSITSHPDYRSTFRNNGIYINHTGARIPQELQEFLNSNILKQQSDPLTPDAITKTIKTAIEIVDSPESNIYNFNRTALLPIKRSDIRRRGNTS